MLFMLTKDDSKNATLPTDLKVQTVIGMEKKKYP